MKPIALQKFDNSGAIVEEYYLPPAKLLAGNPRQCLSNRYTDATGKFSAGTWHSEVGKWKISYSEEEYCQMLAGTSIITDSTGCAITVTAGDQFVIPSGFTGTWEVVMPTRKIYVIYEAGTRN